MKKNPGCGCVSAADEIDRLRDAVMNLCVVNGKQEDEIERLRELAGYLTEERRRLRVEAGYD